MFFDIGANIGLWAKANIQFTNKIIAVEASPITFKMISQYSGLIFLGEQIAMTPGGRRMSIFYPFFS